MGAVSTPVRNKRTGETTHEPTEVGKRILSDPYNLGIKKGEDTRRNKGAALFTLLAGPSKNTLLG